MKIALVTRKIYPFHSFGGMEKYVWELGLHLSQLGEDVHIITVASKDQESKEILNKCGVKIHFLKNFQELGFHSGISYFLFSNSVDKYLKQLDLDLIHSFGISAFVYLLKNNKYRKPVITQAFGNEWFFHKGVKGFVRLPLKLALSYCMKSSEGIAAETDDQLWEIKDLFNVERAKIFILPDGVKLNSFSNVDASVYKQRGALRILNVNRLAPNKGVQYLIDAFKILSERGIDFVADIVGTGPDELQILNSINEFGLSAQVTHHKNVSEEELISLYKYSDLFICPTLQEGLPLVLLDALAASVPVVATRAAQNHIVVKDGENGFLVPPRDAISIADAVQRISRLSDEERHVMGNIGREIVRNYDWGNIANSAVMEYTRLVFKEVG